MSVPSHVFDATREDFDEVVLAASHRVPVLVDFWAAWCGPCRSLTPILEALAREYDGRFLLAKVDTDAERELAGDHGIRSLPTVRLFRDGVVVEEFLGAQPESQVRALLDRHVARDSDAAREQAAALREDGDLAGAVRVLADAFAADPGNDRIPPELTAARLAAGDLEGAREALRGLGATHQEDDDVRALKSLIGFAEAAEGAPPMADLEAAIANDPADCESRYRAGALHVLDGDYESAMEQLLEIVRRDRAFRDDGGRKGMLCVFDLLGAADPRVSEYRSRMASMLY